MATAIEPMGGGKVRKFWCGIGDLEKENDQGFQPQRYEDNSDVVALIDRRGGMLDMLDEDITQKRWFIKKGSLW